MARGSLVAVSYPVDDEFAQINTGVLDGCAAVAFLHGRPDAERPRDPASGRRAHRVAPEPGTARRRPGRTCPASGSIQLLSAERRLGGLRRHPGTADAGQQRRAPTPSRWPSTSWRWRSPWPGGCRSATPTWPRASSRCGNRVLTLDGAVCAILGFGGIGRATARLMRAFGARIHAVNSSGRTSEPVEFIGTLADLDQVLAAADVLVIALPLTTATRGLIGARELALMKPDRDPGERGPGGHRGRAGPLRAPARASPTFCAGIDAWWHEPGGARLGLQHRVPVLRPAQPARVPAQFRRHGRRPSRRGAHGGRERQAVP